MGGIQPDTEEACSLFYALCLELRCNLHETIASEPGVRAGSQVVTHI